MTLDSSKIAIMPEHRCICNFKFLLHLILLLHIYSNILYCYSLIPSYENRKTLNQFIKKTRRTIHVSQSWEGECAVLIICGRNIHVYCLHNVAHHRPTLFRWHSSKSRTHIPFVFICNESVYFIFKLVYYSFWLPSTPFHSIIIYHLFATMSKVSSRSSKYFMQSSMNLTYLHSLRLG